MNKNEIITGACPNCNSLVTEIVNGPDEENLYEYRCKECGEYFVDELPSNEKE